MAPKSGTEQHLQELFASFATIEELDRAFEGVYLVNTDYRALDLDDDQHLKMLREEVLTNLEAYRADALKRLKMYAKAEQVAISRKYVKGMKISEEDFLVSSIRERVNEILKPCIGEDGRLKEDSGLLDKRRAAAHAAWDAIRVFSRINLLRRLINYADELWILKTTILAFDMGSLSRRMGLRFSHYYARARVESAATNRQRAVDKREKNKARDAEIFKIRDEFLSDSKHWPRGRLNEEIGKKVGLGPKRVEQILKQQEQEQSGPDARPPA